MLKEYIQAAMKKATYELLTDGEGFYGEVPMLQGVWANEATLEACRNELEEVIQSWLIIKLRHGDNDFPVLEGIDLNEASVGSTDGQEVA